MSANHDTFASCHPHTHMWVCHLPPPPGFTDHSYSNPRLWYDSDFPQDRLIPLPSPGALVCVCVRCRSRDLWHTWLGIWAGVGIIGDANISNIGRGHTRRGRSCQGAGYFRAARDQPHCASSASHVRPSDALDQCTNRHPLVRLHQLDM